MIWPSTGLALVQGLWLRGRMETLPPAAGPVAGRTDGAPGAVALRLGIIGESTAAGCGAADHESAFAGSLARCLTTIGRPVEWQVAGQHGATARRIRHRLLPRLAGDFDTFPSLPGALARYLMARGRDLDAESRRICAGVPNADFVATSPDLVGDGFFARDGFHPGELGYRHWADAVADVLLDV